MTIPPEILAALDAADQAKAGADESDAAAAVAASALTAAESADLDAKGAQLVAHQTVTETVDDLVAKIKAFFGRA